MEMLRKSPLAELDGVLQAWIARLHQGYVMTRKTRRFHLLYLVMYVDSCNKRRLGLMMARSGCFEWREATFEIWVAAATTNVEVHPMTDPIRGDSKHRFPPVVDVTNPMWCFVPPTTTEVVRTGLAPEDMPRFVEFEKCRRDMTGETCPAGLGPTGLVARFSCRYEFELCEMSVDVTNCGWACVPCETFRVRSPLNLLLEWANPCDHANRGGSDHTLG